MCRRRRSGITASTQYVSDPGFVLDRNAAGHQIAGPRQLHAAQELDDPKQPVCAAHDVPIAVAG